MLTVKNLSVYFNNNNEKSYLLKDISFSINENDSLGIIGKSGDGKSTLAKALLNIYDKNVYLESGVLTLNNEQITKKHIGKKISLVFQNPNSYLNPNMKVGKQIQEMLLIHCKENRKVSKEKTLNIMEEMGIENPKEVYNYYPYQISGGIKQKISLCIAFICNPDVVILDEALSYLDKKSKEEIFSLLKKLKEKYKFILIFISHDFKEIYQLCNKIAVIKKGRIVEMGLNDEIVFNAKHIYTQELLYYFVRYYKNVPLISFNEKEENIDNSKLVKLNATHYFINYQPNGHSGLAEMPSALKENLYEIIRN